MPAADPRGLLSDREIAQHRRRTMSTSGMKALLHQAKAAPTLSLDPDILDGDPYTLCTPGGIVDLRTGRIHHPDPHRDLHSRATNVAPGGMPTPDGTASSPTPSEPTTVARNSSTSSTCYSVTPSPAT